MTVTWNYDRTEIIADGVVHAIGIVLGIAGAVILLVIALRAAHHAEIAPVIIYIVGLLSMLGLSAAYNLWPISPRKWLLRPDHSLSSFGAATSAASQRRLERAKGIEPSYAAWEARWSGFQKYGQVAETLHPLTLWLSIGRQFHQGVNASGNVCKT